ncbi:MAG TPA: sigma-70 family RNA polymerase sigma factor [Thermoanaerobaculia bacterium]|jgi:RNA polymerase sigma-70 factor (ECF subfamily)
MTVTEALVENHRHFLAFLERRVESREVAEDILQEAFVRSIERGDTLRDSESARAWFYRLLRNAIVDHYRRRGVEQRALATVAAESTDHYENDPVMDEVCRCIETLIPTLKPEYADAIERVELQGVSVKAYAESLGISANNAGVRVFRAREALRKSLIKSCGVCTTHGCIDCTCNEVPCASSAPVERRTS